MILNSSGKPYLILMRDNPYINTLEGEPLKMTISILPNAIGDFIKAKIEKNYIIFYKKLEADEEFIKIPSITRREELHEKGVSYVDSQKYLSALSVFKSDNDFEDKNDYLNKIYNGTEKLYSNQEYIYSYKVFRKLPEQGRSKMYIEDIVKQADKFMEQCLYEQALPLIDTIGGDIKKKYKANWDIYSTLAEDEFIEIKSDSKNEFTIDVGNKLANNGKYLAALSVIKSIQNDENTEKLTDNIYNQAIAMLSDKQNKQYVYATKVFTILEDYKDSKQYIAQIKDIVVDEMCQNKDYEDVASIAQIIGGTYLDEIKYILLMQVDPRWSNDISEKIRVYKLIDLKRKENSKGEKYDGLNSLDGIYYQAGESRQKGEYDKAIEIFDLLGDYKDSQKQIVITKYEKAKMLESNSELVEACKLYIQTQDYKDTKKRIDSIYSKAKLDYDKGSNEETAEIFNVLKDINYKDSKELYNKLKK